MSTTNNARRMVILGALTLGLFGCGAAATTSSPPASPSPSASVSTAAPAASTSGYPQQVADQALCTTYENLVQSGDTEGIASAVAGAGSTVTQSLATHAQGSERNHAAAGRTEPGVCGHGLRDCIGRETTHRAEAIRKHIMTRTITWLRSLPRRAGRGRRNIVAGFLLTVVPPGCIPCRHLGGASGRSTVLCS